MNCMKKIFTIVLLLVSLGLTAQSYNNEWIDYSKTYYKFKLATTGLYRISQSLLASAGLGGVPAQNFQLFRNGEEVPIYTSVASGPLGGSDYIEFWGKMNDGVPDSVKAFGATTVAGPIPWIALPTVVSELAFDLPGLADAPSRGLRGSGLVVINPPWKFDETLADAGRWLAATLPLGRGAGHAVRWIHPPK